MYNTITTNVILRTSTRRFVFFHLSVIPYINKLTITSPPVITRDWALSNSVGGTKSLVTGTFIVKKKANYRK